MATLQQTCVTGPRPSTSSAIATSQLVGDSAPLSPTPASWSPSLSLSSASSISSTTLPTTSSSLRTEYALDSTSSVVLDNSEDGHIQGKFATFQSQWLHAAPVLEAVAHMTIDNQENMRELTKAEQAPNAIVVNSLFEEGKAEQQHYIDPASIGVGLSTQEGMQGRSRRRVIESSASRLSDIPSFSGPFAHHRSPSWVAAALPDGRVRARSSAGSDLFSTFPRRLSPLPPPHPHTLPSDLRLLLTNKESESQRPSRTSSMSTTATDTTKMRSTSRSGHCVNEMSPKPRLRSDVSVSSMLPNNVRQHVVQEGESDNEALRLEFPKSTVATTFASTAFTKLAVSGSRNSFGSDDALWLTDDGFRGVAANEDVNNVSLAVSTAEEGHDVRVEARGIRLEDIEHCLSARTTHLILAGSRSVSTLAFLERALPIVAQSLLVLDVSSTGLQEFPEALAQCHHLEELNMSNNPLVQAPAGNVDVIATLSSSLRVLMMDGCGLTMLPLALIELKELRLLSLCHNHLVHLPAWLHYLRHLKSLLLVGNPFQGAWKSVCQPFCHLPSSARNILESSESSTSSSGYDSSVNHYSSTTSDDDDVEEVLAPVARLVKDANEKPEFSRGRSLRPLVRRMLSGNDLKQSENKEQQRNLVNKVDPKVDSESRWNTIKRRLTKRTSDSALDNTGAIHASRLAQGKVLRSGMPPKVVTVEWQHKECFDLTGLPERPRTSLLAPMPDEAKQACRTESVRSSITPSLLTSAKDSSNVSERATCRQAKRASYLPFGVQDDVSLYGENSIPGFPYDSEHCGNVRILMRYLADLSELNPEQQHYLKKLRSRAQNHAVGGDNGFLRNSSPSVGGHDADHDWHTACGAPGAKDNCTTAALASAETRICKENCGDAQPHKDNAYRRAHIIAEIISTEETYVKGLRELIDIYIRPSSVSDATQQSIFTPAERRQVFGNIESIWHFHHDAFLPALRSAASAVLDRAELARPTMDTQTTKAAMEVDEEDLKASTAYAAEQLARTFESHVAYFRMYSSYVNNVDAAQQQVTLWKAQCVLPQAIRSTTGVRRDSSAAFLSKQQQIGAAGSAVGLAPKDRKRIRTFMQNARSHPQHSQLSLEAYLHLPVQRIPRYRLLFEDLDRACPPERLTDKRAIVEALDSVTSVANMMNESKRQSEMGQRLLQWQERIRGVFPSPLVQPHRKLIHDGALTLRRIVTREPSFCVTRSAILGDATMYDHSEEPSLLLVADASRPKTNEQDSTDSLALDYEMLQVCHLKQQNVTQELQVILCNDIIVIVEGNRDGHVKLFAALRVAGPARVINETTLRIVGPSQILYLTASSAREALSWRQALTTAQSPARGALALP